MRSVHDEICIQTHDLGFQIGSEDDSNMNYGRNTNEVQSTMLQLHVLPNEMDYWNQLFSFGFAVAKDNFTTEPSNLYYNLAEINIFDSLLMDLEKIIYLSPEGGCIDLSLNKLQSLVKVSQTYKEMHKPNESNCDLYRRAEICEKYIKDWQCL